MHKLMLIGIAAMIAALLAIAPTALARGGKPDRAKIVTGKCSVSSTWKLKVKSDDGRLETEFEVDQNRAGRRWRVKLARNGVNAFTGIRTTTARSGSFSVSRLIAGAARTRISASATALRGGETCRAAITF
jgi:hypothetical protein